MEHQRQSQDTFKYIERAVRENLKGNREPITELQRLGIRRYFDDDVINGILEYNNSALDCQEGLEYVGERDLRAIKQAGQRTKWAPFLRFLACGGHREGRTRRKNRKVWGGGAYLYPAYPGPGYMEVIA